MEPFGTNGVNLTYQIVCEDGFYSMRDAEGKRVANMPDPSPDKDAFIESLKPYFTQPCIEAFKAGYAVQLPS